MTACVAPESNDDRMNSTGRQVRIGVLGCGNVGSAFVSLATERAKEIEARTGIHLDIVRVAVRNLSRSRDVEIDPALMTNDALTVVTDPDIDLVVEVIGGIEPARELITAALTAGKPVVTANKELLANVGVELFEVAEQAGVDLLFEAAVAGGIPIVRALRESLRGEPISRVMGIVNGTTNYILTKMTEQRMAYEAALAEAQRLGYAERDSTADVEGFDAGAKAAIMATIVSGTKVVAGQVYHGGISNLTLADIDVARRLGYVVKLLAVVDVDRGSGARGAGGKGEGSVGVRVHPAMVPEHHPLASVRDSFNAVFVEGDAVGSLMFYGRGAGGHPTASAVLGDVIDAAVNLAKGTHGSLGSFGRSRIRPIDELTSEYLIGLEVVDEPGVLHAVTGVLAGHGVSIRAAEQEGLGPEARLFFSTHDAKESAVQATVHDLRELPSVRSVDALLRVVGPA
jgi:homoserine dehydrogenase